MVKASLRGINTVRKTLADGSVRKYYYHRASGTPLRGLPGSSEFIASYAKAEAAKGARLSGECSQLIRSYLASPEFDGLKDSTQREYRRLLTKIDARFGAASLGLLQDPRLARDIYAWRDEIAAVTPREADNCAVMFRTLLSWARKRFQITFNLLEGYRRIYSSDRSDKIWEEDHIAAFRREAEPELRDVFDVALELGFRHEDLRLLPWSAYDGQKITWRIRKSRKGTAGVQVSVPCTQALKTLLDGLPRRGPLILTTRTGKAWTKRYLSRQFEIARARAARHVPDIAELHFHDLRGTAITRLAEAGATIPEIASVTGHSFRYVSEILEKYLARSPHLARSAITKRENSRRTNSANRLQTGPSENKKDTH